MEGDAGSAPPTTKSRRWLAVVVMVIAAILGLSAALYYTSLPPLPPANTPPHGLGILVSPSTGNNTTVFTFTAQLTDDQDPASAIHVRWDWQNDGVWDTNWSTTKTASHVFPVPGDYTVKLEARDTGNLTANATQALTVAPPPNTPPRVVGITVVPSSGTNLTTFSFTAQVSDAQDPASAIQVRWDWQNDSVWDTSWSTTKTAMHRFPVPGTYVIVVEAQDTGGLTGNASTTLAVPAANQPPQIQAIEVMPATGNTSTTFTFTAQVTDDWDPTSAILVRWDWQDDGVWDTAWSTTKTATHRYASPGNYTARLEAEDTGGLTSNATQLVNVSVPPEPLRIGTIFSLTGGLDVFGASQQNAVDMAVAEINAAGGVVGHPIVVYHMDDQTNPATAAQDATTLITADNVSVIIGATGSGMCAAIVPIVAANAVLEISPSCTSPLFSNLSFTGGWFARTVPSDALQAVVAAYHALHELGYTRSAVLGIDNVYGTATAAAYASNFTRMGGAITAGSPRIVPVSQPDYTTDLEAALDVSPAPQTLYLIAYPAEGVTIIRDWWNGIATHPSWANVHIMGSDGLYDPNLVKILLSDGVNVTTLDGTSPAIYSGITPPGYSAWAARYNATFGTLPSLFAANAYDATYIAALAAQAAGSGAGYGVRASLQAVADAPGVVVGPDEWANATANLTAGHDINYEGVSGSVDVNAFGNVPGAYIIWGVNSTAAFYVKSYFNESAVVAMLPSNSYYVPRLTLWDPIAAPWSDPLERQSR